MRTVASFVLAGVLGVASACQAVVDVAPPTTARARVVAHQAATVPFYDVLAPYGAWRRTSAHGWVWSPDPRIVGTGFMPYVTGGAWLLTDVGWMWTSVWDWGWAPFHYGRWYWDSLEGWLWVPDTLWAPAWVDWRSGHDFVGWAPLPPGRPHVQIRDHSSYWVFARRIDLDAASIEQVIVPAHEARDAVELTTPIRIEVVHDGRSWYAGPSPLEGDWPLRIKPPHSREIKPPRLNAPPRLPVVPPRQRRVPPRVRVERPAHAIPGNVRTPTAPRPDAGHGR